LPGFEDFSEGQPTLQIETDKLEKGKRVTTVRLNSGSARRWNLAINTTAILAFKLKTVPARKVLVAGGAIVGVEGWHNVQYVTDAEGPSDFELTLLWHSRFREEPSLIMGSETLLLKLRTDANVVTDDLAVVLEKLPAWCVLFGKSTSPYPMAYLSNLKAPTSVSKANTRENF
jgi:hypothetical protein